MKLPSYGSSSQCRRKVYAGRSLCSLLQAELVDGFLAWDFDANTAATFFAQQAHSVNGLICMHALRRIHKLVFLLTAYLTSSRSRARAFNSSWPPADNAVSSRLGGQAGCYPQGFRHASSDKVRAFECKAVRVR